MASRVLRLYRNGLMNFQSARNIHLSSEFLEDSLKKGYTDSTKKAKSDLKKKGPTESGKGPTESGTEGPTESGMEGHNESGKKGHAEPMKKEPTEAMKKLPPEFAKKKPTDMEKRLLTMIKFVAIFLPGLYIGSVLENNGYFDFKDKIKEKKSEEKISLFSGKDSD